MKWLPYILIIVLAFGLGWFVKPSPEAVIEARTDTVFSTSIIVKRDTVKYYLPSPILCWHDGDTIHVGDTILPVEQKIYRDSDYIAYVSGYRSNLDSIYVCSKTLTVTNDIYHTVKIKPRRWGLARQSVLCGTHLLGGSDHYGPVPYRMQGGFPQACVSQSDRRQNEYRSNLFGLQEKRDSNGYLTNLYSRRVSKFVGPRKRSFVPAYLQGFRD